jgi:hypothetical protein
MLKLPKFHKKLLTISWVINMTNYESEYCNSVIECTDSEGNLSEPNVLKLLHDHGASYHEFATDCGHDYHANTVLSWLGY